MASRAMLPSSNGLKLVSRSYFSNILRSAATTKGAKIASMPVDVGTFLSAARLAPGTARTASPAPNDKLNARRVVWCTRQPWSMRPSIGMDGWGPWNVSAAGSAEGLMARQRHEGHHALKPGGVARDRRTRCGYALPRRFYRGRRQGEPDFGILPRRQ